MRPRTFVFSPQPVKLMGCIAAASITRLHHTHGRHGGEPGGVNPRWRYPMRVMLQPGADATRLAGRAGSPPASVSGWVFDEDCGVHADRGDTRFPTRACQQALGIHLTSQEVEFISQLHALRRVVPFTAIGAVAGFIPGLCWAIESHLRKLDNLRKPPNGPPDSHPPTTGNPGDQSSN
jgi:hypothetical protein